MNQPDMVLRAGQNLTPEQVAEIRRRMPPPPPPPAPDPWLITMVGGLYQAQCRACDWLSACYDRNLAARLAATAHHADAHPRGGYQRLDPAHWNQPSAIGTPNSPVHTTPYGAVRRYV